MKTAAENTKSHIWKTASFLYRPVPQVNVSSLYQGLLIRYSPFQELDSSNRYPEGEEQVMWQNSFKPDSGKTKITIVNWSHFKKKHREEFFYDNRAALASENGGPWSWSCTAEPSSPPAGRENSWDSSRCRERSKAWEHCWNSSLMLVFLKRKLLRDPQIIHRHSDFKFKVWAEGHGQANSGLLSILCILAD